MTTYTSIPNSDIDPDSPITTALMTAYRDNPVAITEKAAGAPVLANDYIVNAMIATDAVNADSIAANAVGASEIAAGAVGASEIAANAVGASEIAAGAVHTSELNTGTASTSTTDQYFNFTMTGGMYVFAPQVRNSIGGSTSAYLYGGYSSSVTYQNPASASTSFVTIMGIGRDGISTAYAQWRYVAASPPHDMGDGDIPAFIYAVIDNTTGDVESIAYAEDPVWLANGPTLAMPNAKVKGVGVLVKKDLPVDFSTLSVPARLALLKSASDIIVPITEVLKHADMDIIPHPFQGNDLSGKTVVMLDPVSDAVRDLCEFDKAGEDIHEIIRNKYITIGNTALNRVTPAGLLIPQTAWKAAA